MLRECDPHFRTTAYRTFHGDPVRFSEMEFNTFIYIADAIPNTCTVDIKYLFERLLTNPQPVIFNLETNRIRFLISTNPNRNQIIEPSMLKHIFHEGLQNKFYGSEFENCRVNLIRHKNA